MVCKKVPIYTLNFSLFRLFLAQGSSVIRMLEAFMGEESFFKGVSVSNVFNAVSLSNVL